ncbi:MAG: hypothetical protein JXQ87_11295 [Bacteroidia bacterium]
MINGNSLKTAILCSVGLFCICFQNNTVRSKGLAELIDPNLSPAEAEKTVLEQARLNSIENAFGRVVVGGNTTYILNVNTKEKYESKEAFSEFSNSFVNGEWVRDIEEPKIVKEIRGSDIVYKCTVFCEVRKISNNRPQIDVKTFNCLNEKCETSNFLNNDDFYLKINSTIDGQLAIFIDDGAKTYSLFPYRDLPYEEYKNYELKSNNSKMFFAPYDETSDFNPSIVTELSLSTNKSYESNKVFVIVSKNKFELPILTSDNKPAFLERTPDECNSEDFQKWLIKTRARDAQMACEIVQIGISNDN